MLYDTIYTIIEFYKVTNITWDCKEDFNCILRWGPPKGYKCHDENKMRMKNDLFYSLYRIEDASLYESGLEENGTVFEKKYFKFIILFSVTDTK